MFLREAGDGPALLLIHGAGPDSRGWGATFDDLAADHRVIAFDRRGFGNSLDQPLVDWHGHAEDAAVLLRELSAVPAVVVGWSGIWNDIGSGDGSHLPTARLRTIACPVTCIRGDLSQPWFVRTSDDIPTQLSQAEVRVISGTNHAITFHRPKEFAQAIREAAAAAQPV